jgi:hypothetical protein
LVYCAEKNLAALRKTRFVASSGGNSLQLKKQWTAWDRWLEGKTAEFEMSGCKKAALGMF